MLLYARGLGTNGEMDSVAEEQSAFAAWCGSRTRGPSANNGGATAAQHNALPPHDAAETIGGHTRY